LVRVKRLALTACLPLNRSADLLIGYLGAHKTFDILL